MAKFKGFLHSLHKVDLGDLVSLFEREEELEALAQDEEIGLEQAALLGELGELLKVVIKEGINEKAEESLAEIHKLISPYLDTSEVTPQEVSGVNKDLTEITVKDPEVLISFLDEANEHLEIVEVQTLELEKSRNPDCVNIIFRAMHTIKGVSSFLGLTSINHIAHELENLLDDLREDKISLSEDLFDLLFEGRDILLEELEAIHAFYNSLSKKERKQEFTLKIPPRNMAEFISRVQSVHQASLDGKSQPPGAKPTPAQQSPVEDQDLLSPELIEKFRGETLDFLDQVEKALIALDTGNKSDLEPLEETFRIIHTIKGNSGFFGFGEIEALCMAMEETLDGMRKKEIPLEEKIITKLLDETDQLRRMVDPGEDKKTLSADSGSQVSTQSKTDAPAFDRYSVKKKDIRVDTAKLDQLFDLIGELITAEAMVFDNPELKNLEIDSIQQGVSYLGKITREIQNITMSIRMIPLEGLFGKMQRLVRDLSKKFNKAIGFNVSGQDTEMDRNIIEEISDPLVHIIRNAVDHGLEAQKDRKKLGKPEEGQIWLNARYEGNEIWITIKDDGRGLDLKALKEKARSKNLMSDEELSQAKERDIYGLIFHPGFSTSKEVTEISGRGVGMDVVKKNIEKLRGRVDIQTTQGKGTEFIIKIPLTLAIIDAVNFTASDRLYSLPISDVSEFQNLQNLSTSQTETGQNVLKLREEILPIVHLGEFFHLENQTQVEKPVMMVVKSADRKLALVVDEIVGYRQIVIKPLPEYMGNLQGISGCSLLGNGDVSLIIDSNELTKLVLG
jgi:two-component system chemotaxis sensor kinase CheA